MPEQRTLTARSLPYRETNSTTYTCERCGIVKPASRAPHNICADCRPEAIALGWIPAPATYTCQHCGQEKRANTPDNLTRTHCNACKFNISRRKAA